MDLPWSFCFSFNPNNYQKRQPMKKTWEALMPLFGTIFLILGGCAHNPTTISLAPAVDNISAIQGNLSAVDNKSIVIQQWLKTQK